MEKKAYMVFQSAHKYLSKSCGNLELSWEKWVKNEVCSLQKMKNKEIHKSPDCKKTNMWGTWKILGRRCYDKLRPKATVYITIVKHARGKMFQQEWEGCWKKKIAIYIHICGAKIGLLEENLFVAAKEYRLEWRFMH